MWESVRMYHWNMYVYMSACIILFTDWLQQLCTVHVCLRVSFCSLIGHQWSLAAVVYSACVCVCVSACVLLFTD